MATRDSYERRFDEESGKTTAETSCPECDGVLGTEGGETACKECGLLVDEYRFDHGATPVAFPDDDTDPRRTGAPLTQARHDHGLSSEIGYGKDANGHTLSAQKQRQLGRLRRHHSQARWQSTAQRNLSHACSDIARMAGALDLPRAVREEAAKLFRRAQDADLIQGRSIEAISAASVYAACRCGGVVRTIDDVAGVAQCSVDNLQNGYRVLNFKLGLETTLIHPNSLIPHVASKCDLSHGIRTRALELSIIAEEAGITNGRQPSGVAAACLYLASEDANQSVTQSQLAKAAGTTTNTLRCRYQELQTAVANSSAFGARTNPAR